MRTDIPGPVHAHINMTMRRIIDDAGDIPYWEIPDLEETTNQPHAPCDRDRAARLLGAFIEMVQLELRYRWRDSPYFLAVPEWTRNALLRYPHLTDTLTVIPGWDNPPPHDTTGLWHVIAFLTALSPLETLLYTGNDHSKAAVFPCDSRFITPLLKPAEA